MKYDILDPGHSNLRDSRSNLMASDADPLQALNFWAPFLESALKLSLSEEDAEVALLLKGDTREAWIELQQMQTLNMP